MSDVGSDRCRNTQGFLTKNVKEIFWDLEFLSENSGVGSHRFHCTRINLCPVYLIDCLMSSISDIFMAKTKSLRTVNQLAGKTLVQG